MKKKPVKLTQVYTGVLTVNLPPELHMRLARIARQSCTTVEIVMAVMLALQFPDDRGGVK